MSTPRKNKVAKANEENQERVVVPIDNQRIEHRIDDKAIALEQMKKPISEPLPEMKVTPAPNKVQQTTPVGSTKDVAMSMNVPLTAGPDIKTTAVRNPTSIAEQGKYVPPKTLSDYLAEQRKNLQKDKTDAVKMQKYHALSDVLKALGQMGGSAIGGAIGGNILDSAPAVDAYKESRGYLDALERAKNANEKLRALDEKEFNLAYTKQERDEERAHQTAREKADRDYRQKEKELERQWDIKFYDYKTQIEQAIADKDWARSAQLKLQMAQDEQKHAMDLQRLRNEGTLEEKRLGLETSKWQADTYSMVPIAFDDGTGVEIAEKDYEGLKRRYIGRKIGDRTITKDNIDIILGQNPQLVKDYFNSIGRKVSFVNAAAEEVGATGSGTTTTASDKTGEQHYYYNQMSDQTMVAPARNFESSESTQKSAQQSSQNQAKNLETTKEDVEDIYKELGVEIVN